MRRRDRAASALRRLVAPLRTLPGVVLGLVLVVLLGMYASNDNWDKDPSAPRGDGVYRPILARGDGHLMYLMARSIVLDRDLDFGDDLARFGDPFRQETTKVGRKNIPHPIGPALAWAPALALAHGASKVANVAGAEIPSHGYTMFHQRIVFATTVLFAFGCALISYAVARRWIGGRVAPLYAVVAVVFGTALTYFVTYMPSYAHGLDAFACAGFLGTWALTIGDRRWRRFVYLGLLLGACALVRITGFALGAALAVELAAGAVALLRDRRPREALVLLAQGAATLGIAVVVFVPQLLAWKHMHGEYLVTPMGPKFMRLGHPRFAELLFSSRNGWLSTHPIAYAGLVGLVLVPRRARLVAAGLAVATFLQVYVNACVFDWWAGATYGQRRLCSVTIVLIVGLSALLSFANARLRRIPPWARLGVAAAVLGWFVVWNLAYVEHYRHAVPPGTVQKMCCRHVPRPMAAIAAPVYRWIGNPFALPASAVFAWRHDVPVRRWDETAGDYADVPDLGRYNRGQHRSQTWDWNVPAHGFKRWLITGWGPAQGDPPAWRWTTRRRARLLVPLYTPEPHVYTVPVFPNVAPGEALRVRVGFDDRTYVDRELGPGWHRLTFTVPDVGLGTHELWIDAEVAPFAGAPGAPEPPRSGRPVGVAVGSVKIGLVPDPPRPAPAPIP